MRPPHSGPPASRRLSVRASRPHSGGGTPPQTAGKDAGGPLCLPVGSLYTCTAAAASRAMTASTTRSQRALPNAYSDSSVTPPRR